MIRNWLRKWRQWLVAIFIFGCALIVFFNIIYFVITVRNSIAFVLAQVVLHFDNTEVPFGKYNWSMYLKVL